MYKYVILILTTILCGEYIRIIRSMLFVFVKA